MVFCPGVQKDSTVLPKDRLLHEGEGFYIILRRSKVDFPVQVLKKRVKKYKSRDQGLLTKKQLPSGGSFALEMLLMPKP